MIPFEHWNPQRILGLIAVPNKALSAEALASPKRWRDLKYDDRHVWGTVVDYSPLRLSLDLAVLYTNPARLQCDCAGKKPCEHIVALLLLFARHKHTFAEGVASPSRQPVIPRNSSIATQGQPGDIQRGLAQLDRWLSNLIRNGLAEPHVHTFAFWDEMADRMLAAWMPGLSQWLRETANIAVGGATG